MVLGGHTLYPPPIWLMRQAGRYLPEYRALRAKAGSFLDLCFNPDLAAEVTLQPIDRFDFDAAILFSDILVIPHAMGREVRFVEGEGPVLEPIDAGGIERLLVDGATARLAPVMETVARVRQGLAPEKTLIGFCGAPWTVATYMVAGRGTPDKAPARLMALTDRVAFARLINKLVAASVDYLVAQLAAGADVVMLFDSWAGVLDEHEFDDWCVQPTAAIVAGVRAVEPEARIIGFPLGAGWGLPRYAARTGVDGVGLDWTVPVAEARERLQGQVAVQGNLDPLLLIAGGAAMEDAARRIVAALKDGPFIFNLGHGIRPETPVEHVARLIEVVREAGRESDGV